MLSNSAEKALVQNRLFAVALGVLALGLVKVGQRDRAAQVVLEMLKIEPEPTFSGFFNRIPVPLESMAGSYAEAHRDAGLPERCGPVRFNGAEWFDHEHSVS